MASIAEGASIFKDPRFDWGQDSASIGSDVEGRTTYSGELHRSACAEIRNIVCVQVIVGALFINLFDP